jgi:hypothetical protein
MFSDWNCALDQAYSFSPLDKPLRTGLRWIYRSFSLNSSAVKIFRSYPPPASQRGELLGELIITHFSSDSLGFH